MITADSLQIQASNTGLRIWGPGQIGDVGFDVQWSQAIGPEHNGSSEVKGTVEISQKLIDEFQIGLPDGTVSYTHLTLPTICSV